MALNYVTLTGNLPRAAFATAIFTPSNWLIDATDAQLIPPASKTITLSSQGTFSVSLLATDNSNATPNGWYWTITICGIVGVPSYTANFFLAFANGATQDISSLATVSNPAPVTPYMPVPGGSNPSSGQVPIATGTGEASNWGNVLTSPMTTLGDLIQGGASGAAIRLPPNITTTRKFLRQQGTGSASAAPAWDTLVAGDIPSLPYLQTANNLSDLQSVSAALTNLGIKLPAASVGYTPANPTGTISATEVMMGLGSTCVYTPTGSGKVIINVTGYVANPTAGVATTVGCRFGTGTAPVNGAAVTGTAFGAIADPQVRGPVTSAITGAAVAFTARLSLTPSTAYWFDIALATGNVADTVQILNLAMTIAEQLA